jgi:pimeloyl-ACP methyl ester carboxylesterase
MGKKALNLAEYTFELNMHGMHGRMLKVPAAKKNKNREILLVYGHHALIERWAGLVENLQDYGPVTLADLPGFGGMDSMYKIRQKPDLDTMADYLAALVKMRYKRKRITIIGISYGFVVATRMLQRHPDLVKKVDLLVNIVGFMHRDDFLFKPRQRKLFVGATRILAARPIPFLIRYLMLNKFVIKNLYIRSPFGRRRFLEMEAVDFSSMIDFEVKLWQANDVRTHWATTSEFLNLDNCQKKIGLPVWHVAASNDHYFNNYNVEQHMRVVFSDYTQVVMKSHAHTPNIMGDKKEMAIMLPPKLKRELSKQP